MNRAEDYLDNLEQDRQNLVQALRDNNVEVQDNETMTSLANKVETKVNATINKYFNNSTTYSSYSYGLWGVLVKKILAPEIRIDNLQGAFEDTKFLEEIKSKIILTNLNNTSMAQTFLGCSSLTNIPQIEDTSHITNLNDTYNNCAKVKEFPLITSHNITTMESTYANCTAPSLPDLYTNNVTNMKGVCVNSGIVNFPNWNMEKVTNLSNAFQDCLQLEHVPDLYLPNITTISSMFTRDKNLKTIGDIYTPNATSVSNFLFRCTALRTIGVWTMDRIKNLSYGTFTGVNLENIGGFKNLGKAGACTVPLADMSRLTYQSALNIINTVYDVSALGYTCTINFPRHIKNILTAEDKALANSKGWNV